MEKAETQWDGEAFGLIFSDIGLCEVVLPYRWQGGALAPSARTASYVDQFAAYWRGEATTFAIPLDVRGTAFQRAVWEALLTIPYGETATYQDVARLIGRPSAVRAAARAIGQNPLPIVIPCHRVVGKNNTLTGYAGGLGLKRRLLALEGVDAVRPGGHERFAF